MRQPLQLAFAQVMVDELCRSGVQIAAIAPGSRSTPLALALAGDDRIQLRVAIDERSAAFFALGAAKASGKPAAVITTSGTAVANLFPAIVEARYSATPLIAITADRPAELRDTGANQTIDQVEIFGNMVKWYGDPGVPEIGRQDHWQNITARGFLEAVTAPSGPVHINVPFGEPLLGGPEVDLTGVIASDAATQARPAGDIVDAEDIETLLRWARRQRGLLVVDHPCDSEAVIAFAGAAGWPLLATPISGCRSGPGAISLYDALLRSDRFAKEHAPDVVVQVGGQGTSRYLQRLLADTPDRLVIQTGPVPVDPSRNVTASVQADPSLLLSLATPEIAPLEDSSYLAGWLRADRRAEEVLDRLLGEGDELSEPRVARTLAAGVPPGTTIFVGSSMPVRDLEWFMSPRQDLRVIGNRGASGIDGAVSTALGIAAASPGTVGLIGDLSLLHDRNGSQLARGGIDCVFVVVNNDGGGIFSFLDQAALPGEQFELLFGTPHGYDLSLIAGAEGLPYRLVERASSLVPAVTEARETGGTHILEVRTDRDANAAQHERIWAAVEAAI